MNKNTKQFFTDLYQGCREGCITITTLPDRRNYHVPVTDIDKAASLAQELGQKCHTYYGTALRKKGLNQYTRGDENEIQTVTCLYADIDVKGDGHKQKALPESIDDAIDFVDELPFSPSYIISSGNGLHAIWLLDKPFLIQTSDDLETIRSISTGFGAYIIREGQKRGWFLDNVQDIARMLRVPGTLNFKTDPPRRCEVLTRNTSDGDEVLRYSWDTFLPLFFCAFSCRGFSSFSCHGDPYAYPINPPVLRRHLCPI